MRVIATNGQNHSYLNFVNALKSPATRESYENSLHRYMNHLKITNTDDLLTNAATPRLIEAQIIDYIMSLRNEGVAYSTIKAITNPIFTFYQLNDVLLNRKRVYRYLGEFPNLWYTPFPSFAVTTPCPLPCNAPSLSTVA